MALTSKIRRTLPYLSLLVLAVALYDGWIFYSRWNSAREARNAREQKEAAEAKRTLEQIGQFKILSFYASPPVVPRGKPARLCYGVLGAKTVRLEPPVQPLYPALTFCFEVSPTKDTEYKLVIEDGAGHSAASSAVLRVTR